MALEPTLRIVTPDMVLYDDLRACCFQDQDQTPHLGSTAVFTREGILDAPGVWTFISGVSRLPPFDVIVPYDGLRTFRPSLFRIAVHGTPTVCTGKRMKIVFLGCESRASRVLSFDVVVPYDAWGSWCFPLQVSTSVGFIDGILVVHCKSSWTRQDWSSLLGLV